MNRGDYKRIAELRVADAAYLLRGNRYAAAYYLAGYAIECALKACIARQFRGSNIPDKGSVDKLYVHDLRVLARFANLEGPIREETRSDPQFGAHWLTVQDWSEESRYQFRRNAVEAQTMFDSVADSQHGVLRWLKHYW